MITKAELVTQPLLADPEPLMLRQTDPLSLLFIFKTLGILALLLVAAYLALRWYAGRYNKDVQDQKKMRCVQELRLSVKTRAYLLDVEGRHVLVVDGASGTAVVQVDTPPGSGD